MYSQSHQRPSKGCVSHSGFPILTLPWAFWCNYISDSSYVKLFPYLSLRLGVMGSLRFGIYTTSGPGSHCNLRPVWQSPPNPMYMCSVNSAGQAALTQQDTQIGVGEWQRGGNSSF